MLRVLGPDKLQLLIDNDWYLIESIFYGAYTASLEESARRGGSPSSPSTQPEEVSQGERYMVGVAKVALPLLNWARSIASMFPPDAVSRKVTSEWLISRGEKHYPEVVAVWRGSGERGERWLKVQAKEIVDYLIGRVAYDVNQRKMVTIAPRVKGRGK